MFFTYLTSHSKQATISKLQQLTPNIIKKKQKGKKNKDYPEIPLTKKLGILIVSGSGIGSPITKSESGNITQTDIMNAANKLATKLRSMIRKVPVIDDKSMFPEFLHSKFHSHSGVQLVGNKTLMSVYNNTGNIKKIRKKFEKNRKNRKK